MDTTIRNIDESIYRRLKAKAALGGLSIGDAVNEAFSAWVKTEKANAGKDVSFFDMKPEPFGKKNRNLSMEIDEVLY